MPTLGQTFAAPWPIAQNFFRGWAEYRRAQKTSPAHDAGSSRGSLAPLPPQKVAGGIYFILKRVLHMFYDMGAIFW
jgi:hypothetical protein